MFSLLNNVIVIRKSLCPNSRNLRDISLWDDTAVKRLSMREILRGDRRSQIASFDSKRL